MTISIYVPKGRDEDGLNIRAPSNRLMACRCRDDVRPGPVISNRERRSREVRDLTTLMASIELPFLRFKNHFHRGALRTRAQSQGDGAIREGWSRVTFCDV